MTRWATNRKWCQNMPTVNTRSASCFYCDDIRHEVGGKVTLVGVYPDGTRVQCPPQGAVVLPKFCVIGFFRTPVEQPVESMRCELRLDEQVLHGVDVPNKALAAEKSANSDRKGFTTQLMMEFGGFVIPRAGILRLVMIVDGQAYECSGLRFIATNVKPATP